MIPVTDHIALDEKELEERFVRAAGPGGQNVNKVSTAVELRFDVRGSPSLPDGVRARLERLSGRRLTLEGVLVLQASRFRTQERNRQDALDRLLELIRRAAELVGRSADCLHPSLSHRSSHPRGLLALCRSAHRLVERTLSPSAGVRDAAMPSSN